MAAVRVDGSDLDGASDGSGGAAARPPNFVALRVLTVKCADVMG